MKIYYKIDEWFFFFWSPLANIFFKRNISMMGILILKDVLCFTVVFYFCQIKCVFKYIIHISIDFYEQKPVQAEDQ